MTRITTPTIAALPFDFNDLKSHLRIEHELDDIEICNLAWSAIEHVEQYTGRTFVPATYVVKLQKFPCGDITLRYAPVTGVESIEYYDSGNSEAEFEAYTLIEGTQNSKLVPDSEWPETYDRPDAVTITYHAGKERIPASVRQAIFLLVGAWNENREGEITGTISTQLALGIDRLLHPWRIAPYV